MNKQEKLQARLANTERALFAVVTVLQELQPPFTQNRLEDIMSDYFDANVSLGFDPSQGFIREAD